MTNRRAIAGLSVAITLVGLIILSNLIDPRSPTERQPIEVVTATWTMNDRGIAIHTITLKNNGQERRHDLEIQITYCAKTGTHLATRSKTIYEFLEPGKQLNVTVEDYAPNDAATAADDPGRGLINSMPRSQSSATAMPSSVSSVELKVNPRSVNICVAVARRSAATANSSAPHTR